MVFMAHHKKSTVSILRFYILSDQMDRMMCISMKGERKKERRERERERERKREREKEREREREKKNSLEEREY